MSKSINISTSLRQTINDNVDLSSCVSATDWNEENIELDTDVLSRLANLESEMVKNSNAIDILEANQFTLVNYDGSVSDIEIPDNNEVSSGDYNNLTNRPCYEEQGLITYTCDGNADGKVTVVGGTLEYYVKISDDIDSIQHDSIEAGKVKYVTTYSDGKVEETEAQYIESLEGNDGEIGAISIDTASYIVLKDNFETLIMFEDITFPEKGIYVAFKDGYVSYYTSSISLPGSTVKQLDEKFIPDTIARTTSDELLTQDKNIIGAINEVFQSGVNVKQQLVDALIAKGIGGISTSDSFEVLIGKISDFSTSSSPVPVEGCNLIAVTELPASGDTDSLYILTSIEPNVIHVGREEVATSAMALGDIWVALDAHEDTIRELRTLTIGNISINFRMRSCYQKIGSYSLTEEVFAYSWTGTEWKRVIPVIIPVIAANASTAEYNALKEPYAKFSSSGTKTIKFSESYQGKGTLVLEHTFNFGTGGTTVKVVAKVYDEYGTLYQTVTHNKYIEQEHEETTSTIDILSNGTLELTATLPSGAEITVYASAYCKKA